MKSLFAFFRFYGGLALFVFSVGRAQEVRNETRPGTTTAADAEWETLKGQRGRKASIATQDSPAARTNARQEAVSLFIADADRFQSFYERNPNHSAAKEAKRAEALLLLQAWQFGDVSQLERRKRLVAEIRADPAHPLPARAELAALSDHLEVDLRTELTRPEKLSAYDQVLHRLISEFPTLPSGYEALVRLASDSPDAKAQALAQEVVLMPAPEPTKAEARKLLSRLSLVGQSVPAMVWTLLGRENPFDRARGRPLVVYTWTAAHPGSLAFAREIATKVTAGTALIGVCLDRDSAALRQLVFDEKLPGEQIYDFLGGKGVVAERLVMDRPGLVYMADASGTLQSVSAQHQFSASSKPRPVR